MKRWRTFLETIAARQEIALVALLVLTMAMMIMPMPTMLADVLIATNIGLSVLLMMVAIHIGGAVEFSTLPSLILITTAFRLSLSITTSRMVLVQGDAGEIIRTFGEFVIAGNVVVGLVVYLIITIVQFVVISKGSERVAEVAARFTLDALPGKQISIDTDLKNGDIDQKEARRRRLMLERESQLYGAMDGAMKFVKGDSIASLVIIVVNLVGGITIGCLQRGLSFSDAVHTYSLLAVGDGLIAQIPALLISLTAGIIVTRTGSDSGGNLGQDIFAQLTAEPRTLQIAAVVLAALAIVPGFPTAVFLTLAILIGSSGWALAARAARERERRFVAARRAELDQPEAARLLVAVGERLAGDRDGLDQALEAMRNALGAQLGIRVPRLRLADAAGATTWQLDVNDIPTRAGEAESTDALLADLRRALTGIAGQFIGIQETQRLLKEMEVSYADLVAEATKGAPLVRLAEILRRLLDEAVSIAPFRLLLEAVARWAPLEQNTAVVAEHVRAALSRQICHALAGADRRLAAILVETQLDDAMRQRVNATPVGTDLHLEPKTTERLMTTLRELDARSPHKPLPTVLFASSDLRRHLRALLDRNGFDMPVLCHKELAPGYRVEMVGILRTAQVMGQQQSRPPHLVAVEGGA